MSQEHPLPGDQAAPRRQVTIPFAQITRSPVINVIGLPELIGLLGAGLLAVLVVFAYLYFYLPAQSRLTNIGLERARLQGQVQAAREKSLDDTNISHNIAKIDASLEDFETNWLPVQSSGRLTLYTVLNNLIKANALRNTAGPSYSTLDIVGTKTQVQPGITAEKQSTAKWQSIYPGIAVSVTVEGAYPNLRHFVRDIETSRQFLIINAVEIESVKNSGSTPDQSLAVTQPVQLRNTRNQKAGSPATKPTDPEIAGGRGGLVSLRLEIASYFQRPEAKQLPTN